jgi:hypothetical protein
MKIIIFLIIWVSLILLFSDKVIPNMANEREYEYSNGVGHPLWNDYQ